MRGQVDITPEDFAFIPAVMNEFDTAIHEDTDRMGNKKILFVKKVNGNVYTASIERGNKQIGVITLWKTKARPGARMGLRPSWPNVRNDPGQLS
jgi:hypothetical protein